mmetsp:Transcript_78577/g.163267  ORF Transcript_78577/g.163267 Transcript_78577/m.163267 type:complete len:463 (+) Transcript_78577:323-1711(+)
MASSSTSSVLPTNDAATTAAAATTTQDREEFVAGVARSEGSAVFSEAECQALGGGFHRPQRNRYPLALAALLIGLAASWLLASFVASFEGSLEKEPRAAASLSDLETNRRLAKSSACRAAQPGEPCYAQVQWAMDVGVKEHQDWFLGLSVNSTFRDFQAFMALDESSGCPTPCLAEESALTEAAKSRSDELVGLAGQELGVLGYPEDNRVVAQGQWCSVNVPPNGWNLNSCGASTGLQVRILTYNLFWWNLYGRRGGNGGSAGHLIQAANNENPQFDFMGFQECEDVNWVLNDAGLAGQFGTITGDHAICIAYRLSAWNKLAEGYQNVGEDRWDQWYGTRGGLWGRFQHWGTGQVVLFVNHHGPLPLNTGGVCGGEATAYNLLKMIANTAHPGDAIVLVGDFNAGPGAQTVSSLNSHLFPVYTGNSFGGVDHMLSSCNRVLRNRNLGPGGSDHDALETLLQL